MILVLISIAVTVIGVALLVWSSFDYDEWKVGWGGTAVVTGGTALLFMLLFVILVPSFYQGNKIAYEVELTYLASIKNNDQMTGSERIAALTEVQTINRDIMTTRVWRDNPWVNWFYAREYGDFPLLSFDAVPKATLDVQVNQDK